MNKIKAVKTALAAVAAVALTTSAAFADGAAQTAETPTVAQTPETPAARSERGLEFGGRLGLIMTNSVGAMLVVPVTDTWRVDIGLGGGHIPAWGGLDDYNGGWNVELTAFLEKRFDLSDDGALAFTVGGGLAFGYYGVWWQEEGIRQNTDGSFPTDTVGRQVIDITDRHEGDPAYGFGAQLGLEVKMAFIDPEHSLYNMFKNASVGIMLRPILYIRPDSLEKFPIGTVAFGLTYRTRF